MPSEMPSSRADRRADAVVRRRRRVRDQAFGIAEIVRDLDEAERVLEAEGGFLAALDLERRPSGRRRSSAAWRARPAGDRRGRNR